MKIIGAGIAGLLAANMLRHYSPMILERQGSLPNNHSAVLRFRSHTVGDVTGIPFRKVEVIKASLPWKNPIADALAYADKNSGTMRSDRSIPAKIEQIERYIAPNDFISTLSKNVDIKFNFEFTAIDYGDEPIISTIPMPILMNILGHQQRISFHYVAGTNIIAKVHNCDAYVSLYVPDRSYPFSRVSITGNELIAEIPGYDDYGLSNLPSPSQLAHDAASLLGFDGVRLIEVKHRKQQYAKIQPIDDDERKRFITWASDNHNIYSLGRYACWRPGLLLDDLVQDIRLIDRWISGGSYARKLHDNKKAGVGNAIHSIR